MRDVRARELAGRQFNRISRAQLVDLGLSNEAVTYRLTTGELVAVERGVFAFSPVLEHDEWGLWMGTTLTASGSFLSHVSAAAAMSFWSLPRRLEVVTRPGSGGPRRHGGVLAHRSSTLAGNVTELRGIPITTGARTLLDLSAMGVGDAALARALREAVRLRRTSLGNIGDAMGAHPSRRGTRRLARLVARYADLPLERARSGAEIRAMELLAEASRPLPGLNFRIGGEEADLSWADQRLIIEIDGGPFHLDAGEDRRKEGIWRSAGWTVRRLSSDDVYEQPDRLLALAPNR